MKIRKISRIGQRRQVVIPKPIFEALNLVEGDFVEFEQKRNELILRSKKLVDPEEMLTPEEEKKVARGFEQFKRGEYVSWEKVKRELGL